MAGIPWHSQNRTKGTQGIPAGIGAKFALRHLGGELHHQESMKVHLGSDCHHRENI